MANIANLTKKALRDIITAEELVFVSQRVNETFEDIDSYYNKFNVSQVNDFHRAFEKYNELHALEAETETEQTTTETADSKTEQTAEQKTEQTAKKSDSKQKKADSKTAVETTFNSDNIELKWAESKSRYTVFHKYDSDKSRALMEIFITAKEYHICTKYQHTNSKYHESWGFKYDSRVLDVETVKSIYDKQAELFTAEQQKKADSKQKKAETAEQTEEA